LPSGLRTVGVSPARAQVAGGAEASDVARLGDHEHGCVATDPLDLVERLHPRVGLGALVDLAGQGDDLAVKGSAISRSSNSSRRAG
jgi:hypothetical protein